MSDLLRASYADLKTVKTRSVCQVILEMPIEALVEVVALLGAPVPGNEVWVALARLKDGATQFTEPPAKKGTLAQQAGILCNEPAFQKWFACEGDPEAAAVAVRMRCEVSSRADLDKDDLAAQRFRDMRADYTLWLRGIAA